MEKETAKFILKTTDINSSNTAADYYGLTINNNIGKVGENRTALSWYNVDLKLILGAMYDKYERFNIYLNFIAGSSTGITAETAVNKEFRFFNVQISGLPFINNNSMTMTHIEVPTTASTPWLNTTMNQFPITIYKTPTTTINIDLINILSNTYYAPSVVGKMIGHTVFSFTIVGVDEYRNESTKDNLDLTINRLEIDKKNKMFY
jgi:hypothetical protein